MSSKFIIETLTGTSKNMIYENYKKGMFRVFIVLSIPLELVTYFQYDLSFTNKFFYSLEISVSNISYFLVYLFNKFIGGKTIHRFLRQELEISPDTRKVELRKCYVIKIIFPFFTMVYRP